MDKSKEYILMCEKAKKIQKYFIGIYSDFVYIETNQVKDIFIFYFCSEFKDKIKKFVWLPRQDQLQGMIDPIAKQLVIRFNYWWTDDYNPILGNEFTSMEQLWLAFVMFEKYSKQWVKGDWIIVEKR